MAAFRGSHETWQGVLIEVFPEGKPNTQAERVYRRLSESAVSASRRCGVASRT